MIKTFKKYIPIADIAQRTLLNFKQIRQHLVSTSRMLNQISKCVIFSACLNKRKVKLERVGAVISH